MSDLIQNNGGSSGDQTAGARVGVVLFQLGGPDSLDAVEPFLFKLFSDPDIIDFPFARLARPTLARIIASRRAQKVRDHYASIGGKSPIGDLTRRQAEALERELRHDTDARVFVAMRYWHPLTEDVVREVDSHRPRHLVLLPLYPQYSKTTTGSSLNEWRRRYPPADSRPEPKVITEFYGHPEYIEALVENINEGLGKFGVLDSPDYAGDQRFHPSPDVHLVFSAHGVPLSVIERGDPYQQQIEATVELAMRRGRWANPHRICYQSRVGPGRWLEPSLHATIEKLAEQGADKILVVPVSFVTDHVETLGELDIEARALATHLGIRQFEVMPALNDSPKFIRALADLVLNSLNGHREGPGGGRLRAGWQ